MFKQKKRMLNMSNMFNTFSSVFYCNKFNCVLNKPRFRMLSIVLVHGGAGEMPKSRIAPKLNGCKNAAKAGYKALTDCGSVAHAVVVALSLLENNPIFNCGYGSVVTVAREVEMDASIMVGKDLSSGAVGALKDIKNPIGLAKLVMEKTPHVFLVAHGATKFAKQQGIPILAPGSLVTKEAIDALVHYEKYGGQLTETGTDDEKKGDGGTVGAVVLDSDGHMAAGTSTGGLNGKMVGRCSDSSQIGSGTYADDNAGAVSITGHGESILKFCLAHTIIKCIEEGMSAQEAADTSVKAMEKRLDNTAGAIVLTRTGEIGIAFSSKHMSWAYQIGNEIHYGLELGQHEMEIV